MSEVYSVVMTGQLAEGFELHQVKANVSTLFKINSGQIEKMFSGKPVTIRRGIEKEQALKLCSALAKAGALAAVKVSRPSSASPEPKTAETVQATEPVKAKDLSAPNICCPRCGHEQTFVTVCGLCKMDLTLHIQRLKRKELARAKRQQQAVG
ncbi:MAG: hypothetical protein V3T17_11080 [Pseudomonadales bacterium]